MLDAHGVTEENWRDACAVQPHFAISESPRLVGRGVAALAADPARARWQGTSTSSGDLAREYGLTDLDGSAPDAWRYLVEVQDPGRPHRLPLITTRCTQRLPHLPPRAPDHDHRGGDRDPLRVTAA